MAAILPKKPGDLDIGKFKVTYAGEHDTKELYKLIHEWLKDNHWQDVQTGALGDMHEIMYHDRTGPSGRNDVWIWWRLEKPSKNSYYKFEMNVDFLLIGMAKTQIVYEGRKIKCDEGELNIEVTAKIVIDPGKKWENHPILKGLNWWFARRLLKNDFDNKETELWRQAYDLQGAIKKYLHLRGFLAQMKVEPFFPSREYAIGKG